MMHKIIKGMKDAIAQAKEWNDAKDKQFAELCNEGFSPYMASFLTNLNFRIMRLEEESFKRNQSKDGGSNG